MKRNQVRIPSAVFRVTRSLVFALSLGFVLVHTLDAQSTRRYTGASGGAWLTVGNWSNSIWAGDAPLAAPAGEGTATDIMSTVATNNASNVGINMNTLAAAGGVGLVLGGIELIKTDATTLQIGNSSTTVNGILQINGATINGVNDTLIRVAGSASLTISNVNTGSGSQTMGLRLGNANGIFDVATSRTLTLSSTISESAANSGFTKTGAGTLAMNANNTYTGNTTISAGTLQIGELSTVPAKLGNGTGTIVLAGGTLFRAAQNTIETHSNPLSVTDNSTMSGNTTSSRFLTFSTSTISLTSGKTLTIRNTAAGGLFEVRLTGGGFTWSEPIILGQAAEGIGSLGPRNDITSGDQTYSGVISGIGKIVRNVPSTIAGGNAIISNGGNSYSGGTELRAGFIGLGADNPLGTGTVTIGWDPNSLGLYSVGASRVLTNFLTTDLATGPSPGGINGATNLQIKGSQNLTLSGPIEVHTNITYLTISNTGLTTISGVITNKGPATSGGIFKQGPGTLLLAGNNTYNGLTTVGAGKLVLGASERIPNGSALSISSGAVVDLASFSETVGTLAGAGLLTNSTGTGALITSGNGSTTFSGVAGGTLSLTKGGTGTLSLTGVNTYSSDTTNAAGTISLNATSTLGNGAGTLVLSGGSILGNNNRPSAPVSNPVLLTANASIFGDSATASSTRILPFSGSFSGTAGTLTIRNTGIATTVFRMDFTGSGYNFSRPIVIGDPGDVAGALSEMAGLNGAGTDQTFSGDISGSGAFRRPSTGSTGRTILTGNNTYTGGTIVTLGTLAVNNTTGSGTGSGAVTVNGGTLAGTGTVAGSVSLSSSISPGSSVGTLTTGGETWNSGGSYIWEIDDASGTAGTSPGWDLLGITGNLNVQSTSGSKFTIEPHTLSAGTPGNMANFSATDTDYSWRLASVGTTIDNFAANKFAINAAYVSNNLAGGHLSITTSGADLLLTFSSNRPPVAAMDSVARSPGSSVKIPITALVANDTDVDSAFVSDTISFVSVASTSTNGASVSNDLTRVFYYPTNLIDATSDAFDYTIQDSFGHQATGTVVVNVNSPSGLAQAINTGGGFVTVDFSGVPGYQYVVERAEDVAFSVNPTNLSTNVAPANGQFSVTDTSPPQPTGYYRLRYSP